MCRHLAYLGRPRTLASLLYEPSHSLNRQSMKTFEQRWVDMNPDGWGVGWWDQGKRPEPARYRTDKPMWSDRSFDSVATLVEADAILAAVRAATPGTPVVETGSAPFTSGRWLFSLNGFVTDFPGPAADRLRRMLSPERSARLEGTTDSEVLFGLVLDRIEAGERPADAVEAVSDLVLADSVGELNLLLSDGHQIVATTAGNTLYLLEDHGLAEGGVLLASEPLVEDAAWQRVPDRTLVVATRDGHHLRPMAGAEGAA